MIIIGGTALNYFGMARKPPADVDVFTSDESYSEKGVDTQVVPESVLQLIPNSNGYATPDAVYTIKCSHFGWDIKWQKTKLDILWMKSKGCKLIPELYEALVEHWKEVNGNKEFLSLDKSKEEFFQDNVTYVFDHDYLHELVAYPNRPMYEQCLKDGEEVLIDKDKFDKLSFEDQVRMFREEISVIAAERWLINTHWCGRVSWWEAYHLSLQKTITSLIKNWAQDFVVLNLEYFVTPEYQYFDYLFQETNIKGEVMGNVNLNVFEKISEAAGMETDKMVYHMCEGYFDVDVRNECPPFPDRGERKWSNPAYQKEVQDWRALEEKIREEKSEALGIEYEHLEQEGGGEGGSEYCYGVFKLNGKIYKAEYSYYSYNGHEYFDILYTLKEVKPVEKIVTVWE